MRYAVGVDLGGTNVRAGLVREDGWCYGVEMRPVDAASDGDELVAQIAALVAPMRERGKGEVVGVGVGVPGALAGPARRVLPGLCNQEGLIGYPFQARLRERLGVPCYLGNDANLILLGEAAFGAARGVANVLCVTLGTGIGGGLLLDGRLREGPHGVAGEIGVARFFTGGASPASILGLTAASLTLEEMASATAIARLHGATSEDAFRAAQSGDPAAQALWQEVYNLLGAAIANAHLLLDLECVVLSGGITKAGEPLRAGVEAAFRRYCPPEYHLGLTVVCGALGEAAGILGGASLCFKGEA
jgi:glucokinase